MAKVEILTGVERQRRWSTEQKLLILQEAFGVDGTVSDVARRHDVLPQQIYAWRKKFSLPKLNSPEIASFIPVSPRRPQKGTPPRPIILQGTNCHLYYRLVSKGESC